MERGRLSGLDGLRGIAAVVVMLHHFANELSGLTVLASGYLCVDFFFMLSGFVIDRVYRPRLLAGMSFFDFSFSRLSRLYPVMLCGIAAGAFVFALLGMAPLVIFSRFLAQALFIPYPIGSIYKLDGVQWSLTFELFANALHVLILYRLSKSQLIGVAVLSYFCLLFATYDHGSMALGDTAKQFWGGVPRTLFGYSIGVLLNRLALEGRIPAVSVPLPALGATLVGVMLVAGMTQSGMWWADPLIILTFPAILVAGISSPARNRRGAYWMGALSYPLYAMHLPAMNFVKFLGPSDPAQRMVMSIAVAGTLAVGAHFLADYLRRRKAPKPDHALALPSKGWPLRSIGNQNTEPSQ